MVWACRPGRTDKGREIIGRVTHWITSFIAANTPLGLISFGLRARSTATMTTSAARQIVRVVPAILGRVKPREVLEKAGLTIAGIVAPRVSMNQFVDQMMWVSRILKILKSLFKMGISVCFMDSLMAKGMSVAPQAWRLHCS